MSNREPMLGLVLPDYAHSLGACKENCGDMCENLQLRCEDSQLKLDFRSEKKLLLPFTGQIPVSKEQSIRTHFWHEIQSESKAWRRVGHKKHGSFESCYRNTTGTQTYLVHMVCYFKRSSLYCLLTAKLLVLKETIISVCIAVNSISRTKYNHYTSEGVWLMTRRKKKWAQTSLWSTTTTSSTVLGLPVRSVVWALLFWETQKGDNIYINHVCICISLVRNKWFGLQWLV